MNEPLQRLVYCSRSRLVSGDPALADEIRRILGSSQRNNSRVGVTGALMFNAGWFGQVLEGPARAVEATFERIQCDDRHGDVALLQFAGVEQRAFPNWSMAFVGRSARHEDLFGDVATRSGFDFSRLQGERLFNVLHELLLREEADALA